MTAEGNVFDFAPKRENVIGRKKPDPRKGPVTWSNFGQQNLPQELAEVVIRLKESRNHPDIKTYNDAFRYLMTVGLKGVEEELQDERISYLRRKNERAEAAAADIREFDSDMKVVDDRERALDNSKSDVRKVTIIRECYDDLKTLHPDVQGRMLKLIREHEKEK